MALGNSCLPSSAGTDHEDFFSSISGLVPRHCSGTVLLDVPVESACVHVCCKFGYVDKRNGFKAVWK